MFKRASARFLQSLTNSKQKCAGKIYEVCVAEHEKMIFAIKIVLKKIRRIENIHQLIFFIHFMLLHC